MQPQHELQQLLARQEALKQELKARKKELQDAQRRSTKDNLQNARFGALKPASPPPNASAAPAA